MRKYEKNVGDGRGLPATCLQSQSVLVILILPLLRDRELVRNTPPRRFDGFL